MEEETFFEKVEEIKLVYRILILGGTLLLLGGLFVFFVYMPKSEEIIRYEKQISALEQKINQARIKTKNLEKFKEEMALVNSAFLEALKLLPNESEIPSLLRTITQKGADSNLEFNLFSPKKERPKNFYIEIPVSIKVSGKYHDVAVFFDKVSKMERIVNIVDVAMKPIKKRSIDLTTSCTALTYRFKERVKVDEGGKKRKK